MIRHKKCGNEVQTATYKYIAVVGDCDVAVWKDGKLKALGDHRAKQVYQGLDDPTCSPELYCVQCRHYYPYSDFEFIVNCPRCNNPDPQILITSPRCQRLGESLLVCELCLHQNCPTCSRNHRCSTWVYSREDYPQIFRDLEAR